jgi:hypothetical protein
VATAARARRPYRWTGDYGIPGLLAALDVDARAARSALPPQRLPGDAGTCPPELPLEDRDERSPRIAIRRAAIRLAAIEPAPPPPCVFEVRRRLAEAGRLR